MTPEEISRRGSELYEKFHDKVNDFLMKMVDEESPPDSPELFDLMAAMAGKAAVVSGALMLGATFKVGASESVNIAQSWLKQFKNGLKSRN